MSFDGRRGVASILPRRGILRFSCIRGLKKPRIEVCLGLRLVIWCAILKAFCFGFGVGPFLVPSLFLVFSRIVLEVLELCL